MTMKFQKLPTTRLNLDTSVHTHATDADGKVILDEDTGKPVQTAQDMVTGIWYRKLADSFPFFGPKKGALQAMIDAGAIHVPHPNEKFRGVWVPLEGQDDAVEEYEDVEEVHPHAETGEATKVVVKRPKKAAKKVASKRASR